MTKSTPNPNREYRRSQLRSLFVIRSSFVIRHSTFVIHFTVCLLLAVALPGCRAWPWRPGPVAPSVAKCRELSGQGLTAIDQDQWPQAEKLLAEAVAASPVDVDARKHYAETLLKRGASAEALVQLDEAMRLSDRDASLAVRSGEVYLAMGQLEAAERRAARALQIDIASADAWALRGRITAMRGDKRQALADFQRAIGYRRDDRQLLYEMAQLYRQLDRPDRALVCLQTLADTYPSGEEPRELLIDQAQTLTAVARHVDAAACYERALKRGDPTSDLQFNLAQSYLAAGQAQRAQNAAQAGLALAPGDPRGRELLSRLAASPSGRAMR